IQVVCHRWPVTAAVKEAPVEEVTRHGPHLSPEGRVVPRHEAGAGSANASIVDPRNETSIRLQRNAVAGRRSRVEHRVASHRRGKAGAPPEEACSGGPEDRYGRRFYVD